uniref:Uncharacterized protein n=1 Tax=Anguilla anguilla TaxID=7936 RepID=A0A0E9W1V1_ANGAN
MDHAYKSMHMDIL